MADDMILHFTSNSSNQSDQSSKIAKLEARMVGKAVVTQPQVQSQLNSLSPGHINLDDSMIDTDESDDDDNVGEFLILANNQKRQKVEEDSSSPLVEGSNSSENVHLAAADTRQKTKEIVDSDMAVADVSKRKRGRGKANSVSGRGRGNKVTDQPKNEIISPSNDHMENSHHKVWW